MKIKQAKGADGSRVKKTMKRPKEEGKNGKICMQYLRLCL